VLRVLGAKLGEQTDGGTTAVLHESTGDNLGLLCLVRDRRVMSRADMKARGKRQEARRERREARGERRETVEERREAVEERHEVKARDKTHYLEGLAQSAVGPLHGTLHLLSLGSEVVGDSLWEGGGGGSLG
jgi:hypothetical protein